MSKHSSAHATLSQSTGSTRSNASVLDRQHTFGPHICVQREATARTVHPAASSLVREVIESPGYPLDAATRSRMEPRFGYDFSPVRVHCDDRAVKSAQAVNAKAYTAGSHVVFGEGQYTPASPRGQNLLAHELTHVTQQASGPVDATPVADGLSVSLPGDRFETAAQQTGAGISGIRPASTRRTVKPGPEPVSKPLVLQRVDDTSPQGNYTQRQTSAAESSATAANVSAGTGIFTGAVGAFTGLVGAYAAVRAANFAERSAQAAEDPPTAEPTTGGITVTDADIPEIKALDTKKIDDPEKDPDSVTVQTGTDVETPSGQDFGTSRGTDVETTTGSAAGTTKTTTKSGTSSTRRASTITKRDSTSKTFKPPEKPDTLKTYKFLNINQGKDDSADFYVSIRSNSEDIKDGGTEPPQSTGYLGGSSESNLSVSFKARPGQHNQDGSSTVRLLIGGTNTPPRKTLQKSSFFGAQGPEINKNYGVQRFGGSITFDAHPEMPPIVDKRLQDAAKQGNGPASDALVTISLPERYQPTAKKYEKK